MTLNIDPCAPRANKSRRTLFGQAAGLGAALFAGAVLPVLAAPLDPDAELIRICHEFATADLTHWYQYVNAPEDTADELFGDREPDWATLRLIEATPAMTPEGWHAKALAYAAWDREAYGGDKEDSGTALLASLLRDMVKPARGAILEALARRYGPLPETYDADGVWLGFPEEADEGAA